MSYSNHYKDKLRDKPKKVESRAKKPGLKPLKAFEGLARFIRDERTRNVFGLFLIISSAALLVAFTSFLFTWKIDQDKLFRLSWLEVVNNPEVEIENWLGVFGAVISHQFINNGFGLSSFLFVLVLFLLGFRIIFKTDLVPFGKTLAYSAFFLIWASVFLGAVFHNDYYFLGGAFGYSVNTWMIGVIGRIGAALVILFSFVVFAIVAFNMTLQNIRDRFMKTVSTEEDYLTKDDTNAVETDEAQDEIPEDLSSILNGDKGKDVVTEDVQTKGKDDGLDLDIEALVEESVPEVASTHDGLDMEVENLSTNISTQENEDEAVDLEAGEDDLDLDVEAGTGDGPLSEEERAGPGEMEDYDPLLDLSRYAYPPLDLLKDHGDGNISVERDELENNKNKIVETLRNYNIGIAKIKATIGPTVTLYEIVPEAGVRISKIKNLEDDIALSLSALGIRIIAPIPGKGTIGIEVPNQNPDVVSMRTVINSEKFQHAKMELPIAMGKTISNETFVVDLAKMPHLLMAGATGQGKSVGLNCILASLLYKKHPAQVKFVLVDPKKVELTLFNKIERHFLAKLPDEEEPIITDTSKVVQTLNSLCVEMDQRYELLKEAQCRNIKEYNAKFIKRKLNPNNGHRYLPYIILVVDEFADLIMTAGKEVELPIARLAQLARAIGIHLIVATQRPSVNIITGTIKANFPSRIAFRVTSKIDSRTILDAGGAEQLIGRGDMLYSNGNDLVRLQCAFVDTPEVEDITEFIGNQQGYPDAHLLPEFIDESSGGGGGNNLEDMERDALFEDAARLVVINQQGSASLLQRKLKLGYNRAGRIVDQLEAAGIIGPFEGSKARQVLFSDEVSLEQYLSNMDD